MVYHKYQLILLACFITFKDITNLNENKIISAKLCWDLSSAIEISDNFCSFIRNNSKQNLHLVCVFRAGITKISESRNIPLPLTYRTDLNTGNCNDHHII